MMPSCFGGAWMLATQTHTPMIMPASAAMRRVMYVFIRRAATRNSRSTMGRKVTGILDLRFTIYDLRVAIGHQSAALASPLALSLSSRSFHQGERTLGEVRAQTPVQPPGDQHRRPNAQPQGQSLRRDKPRRPRIEWQEE